MKFEKILDCLRLITSKGNVDTLKVKEEREVEEPKATDFTEEKVEEPDRLMNFAGHGNLNGGFHMLNSPGTPGQNTASLFKPDDFTGSESVSLAASGHAIEHLCIDRLSRIQNLAKKNQTREIRDMSFDDQFFFQQIIRCRRCSLHFADSLQELLQDSQDSKTT